MKKLIVSLLIFVVLLGCTTLYDGFRDPMRTDTVIGLPEQPDPILVRIVELQAEGVITEVIIMESYPLQFMITARQSVFDSLEEIRKAYNDS